MIVSRRIYNTEDRLVGMLVGLAIGDMLGTPVELMNVGESEPIAEPIEGGPFNLPIGCWADDTIQALCIADSLLRSGGYDSYDIVDRFWLRRSKCYKSSTGRCFGGGNQTRTAINKYKMTDGIVKADAPRISEAGNGATIQLAPIVIAAYKKRTFDSIITMAGISAHETHHSLEAQYVTEVFAELLCRAVLATRKEEIIRLHQPKDRLFFIDNDIGENSDPKNKIYSLLKSVTTERIKKLPNNGNGPESLMIAVWGLMNFNTFKAGALAVVNLGDDAGSSAAAYGQLAGAYYSYSQIPLEWLSVLNQEKEIAAIARQLSKMRSCPVVRTRFKEDGEYFRKNRYQ